MKALPGAPLPREATFSAISGGVGVYATVDVLGNVVQRRTEPMQPGAIIQWEPSAPATTPEPLIVPLRRICKHPRFDGLVAEREGAVGTPVWPDDCGVAAAYLAHIWFAQRCATEAVLNARCEAVSAVNKVWVSHLEDLPTWQDAVICAHQAGFSRELIDEIVVGLGSFILADDEGDTPLTLALDELLDETFSGKGRCG